MTSDEENKFLLALATRRSFSTNTVVWLGATDEAQESNWVWVTGESFNSGEHFLAAGGRAENYLNLRLSSGNWEDYPAAGERAGDQWYACEWER